MNLNNCTDLINVEQLPGGTNASRQALYWLMEAMIKTEAAMKEILKVPEFKSEILDSTKVRITTAGHSPVNSTYFHKEIHFGGDAKLSVTRNSTSGVLLCKIAFANEKETFYTTQRTTKEAILNIY